MIGNRKRCKVIRFGKNDVAAMASGLAPTEALESSDNLLGAQEGNTHSHADFQLSSVDGRR